MKVYIDTNDIGKTVTYKEENGKRQHLYVHDNEGFIFKELADYTKQVRKEVCEQIIDLARKRNNDQFYIMVDEILDQIQGE